MRAASIVLLMAMSGAVACVPTTRYNAAVADADHAKAELEAARADAKRQAAARDAELADLKRASSDADTQRGHDLETCTKALDEATAQNQELRSELERQGKDVDQLLSAKGALASSLDQARARLEELRRAQAAADSRSALFRDIALRLKRMLDAGELSITLRSGRMMLVLPSDVLFDSGQAKLKPHGKKTIAQVASVLASVEGRRFQVAGHTDNEPIRISGFGSNWELSVKRALEVVSLLVESGMHPQSLSAAGYGEFDPMRPNDSPDNRAKNRRIEISLQPNIDELVAVPPPK